MTAGQTRWFERGWFASLSVVFNRSVIEFVFDVSCGDTAAVPTVHSQLEVIQSEISSSGSQGEWLVL